MVQLALHCRLEKSNKTEVFKDWLTKVKCVDDLMHAEKADFEALAKATHKVGRCNNTLSELSHCANTNNGTTSSSASTCISLPKLSDIECKLLFNIEGCLKCCHVFVSHHSSNCPNDFPDAATYKALTQATVDAISKCLRKNAASIMTTTENAAGMSSTQPIAVVMGVFTNPVTYMSSNMSNVIKGDSVNSETSVSSPPIAAVLQPELSPTLTVSVSDIPHSPSHTSSGNVPLVDPLTAFL